MKRPPTRDAEAHKRMVLEAYAKSDRPILTGHVSLLRGWQYTLLETEDLLEDMVAEKKLRRITASEKHRFGIEMGYFLV